MKYFKKDELIVGEIVCNPIQIPQSELDEKSTKVVETRGKLGRNLMDSLLKEASTPEPASFNDMDWTLGDSDGDFAIKDELEDAAEKMNEKLFENAKFFIDYDSSKNMKMRKNIAKLAHHEQNADTDELLKKIAARKLEKPSVGQESVDQNSYLARARARATVRGKRWIEREDLGKALLRIDFNELGKLTGEEKTVSDKIIGIVRGFKTVVSNDEGVRKATFQEVSVQYAEMVNLFITVSFSRYQDSG